MQIWNPGALAVHNIESKNDENLIGFVSVGSFVILAIMKGDLQVWDFRAEHEPKIETSFGDGIVVHLNIEMNLFCFLKRFKTFSLFSPVTENDLKRKRLVA